MSKTKPITLSEFKMLVEGARRIHASKEEPIPELNESKLEQLDSTLKTPFQTFGGKDLYPDFLEKAAILFYLINKNHVLSNGNKRMACLSLGYFCYINRKKLTIPEDEFYELAKTVTMSKAEDKEQVVEEIKKILSAYLK